MTTRASPAPVTRPLTFLEARRVLASFAGGAELPFLLAMSGTPEPLLVYLQAAAARRGRQVTPRTLPFNTIGQALAADPVAGEAEVFLLFPWDFVPESDWRSGVSPRRADPGELLRHAEDIAARIRRRPMARVVYAPAPIPPTAGTPDGDRQLAMGIAALAAGLGATLLSADCIALGALFASGCPIGGASLGTVAERVIDALLAPTADVSKVLVTDLDNVLWSGVVAEDGVEGIAWSPEGKGFRHFVYQTLLARLRREGVLLAAVSRNDHEVALEPIRSGRMTLGEDDFVAVLASYYPKSAQIRQLATQLNLGLDAFVFVDDNPVELEEVAAALPDVRCVAFPDHDDELADFLADLCARFARRDVTAEDRDRTALYRRRIEGVAPENATGADLTAFLAGLDMRLTVDDRSTGERARAVQLINKTNQFNLNGRRWTDAEVAAVLAAGGRLLCASLADRSGSHGEILALLTGPDGTAEAMVMSCRVFQRRVEHAFLVTLADRGLSPRAFRYTPTDRNSPLQQFINDPAFQSPEPGLVAFDAAAFAATHHADLELFEVTWS